MNKYDHQAIEKMWQEKWAASGAYKTSDSPKNKYYCLDMFPYPSGAGLHVGHPLGYTATDIISRKRRAEGYDVLHPMGWDAFGLPAENYAIKTGTPPQETTANSIQRFRTQLQSLGFSYDWSREVNTSNPEYYRWTQWLFIKLYERGLAYQKEAPVNWCPHCQTVLADSQVIDGKCERCGSQVQQRDLKQWFFKITEYADELLAGLDTLDWPERIKLMQQNWIGRSEGARIQFGVSDSESTIEVFTTRPDTLYGVTFLVLAPEHSFIGEHRSQITNIEQIDAYVDQTLNKSELDRKATTEKTGLQLDGLTAIHPITGESLPLWVADYVLPGYGTGAIMAVPAHDERDAEFAATFSLNTKQVIETSTDSHSDPGKITNSDDWNGLHSDQDKDKIIESLNARGIGKAETTYRLRDWLVSRQRYWGAPIPIIHCESCGALPVPEDQLPVLLPSDVDFKPTGESPLERSQSFHANVACPQCGAAARRESDTMDGFVDNSWYFFRYTDPNSAEALADKVNVGTWLPVDLYVGGAEHATGHLLFSRFITKALDDIVGFGFREPFSRYRSLGLIIAEDGRKMSKSYGNVINPDEVVAQFGADSLRCYEMFMGPFEDAKLWSTRSLIGVRRWLERVWQLQEMVTDNVTDNPVISLKLEQTVKKVTDDIELFKFNTCISAMMELTNALKGESSISSELFHRFLQLLAPFAPHLAEELYALTGGTESLQLMVWPVANEALLVLDTVTLAIQVNGKLRGTTEVSPTADEAFVVRQAKSDSSIERYLTGQEIMKVIYIPGKVLNLVAKPRKA